MNNNLDHRTLYRFPWSLADNAIAWLEPTSKCNLRCEGCYRNHVDRHKTIDEIDADLDVFARKRMAWIAVLGLFSLTLVSCAAPPRTGRESVVEEAKALGNRYFETLKQGDEEAASKLYSPLFFDAIPRERWSSQRASFHGMLGHYQAHKLLISRSSILMGGIETGNCVALTYHVTYSKQATRETLTVCVPLHGGDPLIVSHIINDLFGRPI